MGTISNARVTLGLGADGKATALVEWDTDVAADGSVTFGIGSSPAGDGSNIAGTLRNGAFSNLHQFNLTGLATSTGYFARVASTDDIGDAMGYDGNTVSLSGVITFTTQAGTVTPPTGGDDDEHEHSDHGRGHGRGHDGHGDGGGEHEDRGRGRGVGGGRDNH